MAIPPGTTNPNGCVAGGGPGKYYLSSNMRWAYDGEATNSGICRGLELSNDQEDYYDLFFAQRIPDAFIDRGIIIRSIRVSYRFYPGSYPSLAPGGYPPVIPTTWPFSDVFPGLTADPQYVLDPIVGPSIPGVGIDSPDIQTFNIFGTNARVAIVLCDPDMDFGGLQIQDNFHDHNYTQPFLVTNFPTSTTGFDNPNPWPYGPGYPGYSFDTVQPLFDDKFALSPVCWKVDPIAPIPAPINSVSSLDPVPSVKPPLNWWQANVSFLGTTPEIFSATKQVYIPMRVKRDSSGPTGLKGEIRSNLRLTAWADSPGYDTTESGYYGFTENWYLYPSIEITYDPLIPF